MHGEKVQMWLNKLKIAIIEKNTEQINALLEELPSFKDIEEMKEAQHLLKEAAILLISLKSETQDSMQQIQKNISFLKSTQANSTPTLDIKL